MNLCAQVPGAQHAMKLKERILVGVSAATVLLTLLLVLDLQLDLGVSGRHLLPSHGRVRLAPPSVFRRRFLERPQGNLASGNSSASSEATRTEGQHDGFDDLVDYVANNFDPVPAGEARLGFPRKNPRMVDLLPFPPDR